MRNTRDTGDRGAGRDSCARSEAHQEGELSLIHIFSKTLLSVFTPVQIMMMRFLVAYAVLWCMYPKTEKTTAVDNLGMFFMSLFADTAYFLCENNALR